MLLIKQEWSEEKVEEEFSKLEENWELSQFEREELKNK